MSKDLFEQLMAQAQGSDEGRKVEPLTPLQLAAKAERLREFNRSISAVHMFSVGDLVQWKPGMRNRRFPEYGEPAVVTQLVSPGTYASNHDSGSPYFREQFTIVIGHVDREGEFLEHHMDGRRFEPYTGPDDVDTVQ